jgi:hypothetical protein
MRIGIHSGLVVVGKIGDDLRMDYTAVGDTTNLAARLEQSAAPGSILISQATERLVSGFFELTDLGSIGVKGKAEAVRAFQVLAERPARGRIEAIAEQGLTPLVGREGQLDALRAAFEAARDGRGQVVFVTGEAGIGKSRLLYEFRQQLGDAPHVWWEGRCASYASHTAFRPIVDALQRRFGIEDRDDDDAALARLEQGTGALAPDLAWTLPLLAQLLSLRVEDAAVREMDAVTRRSETFRALHALLLESAARATVVLAIEDLHWIDAASEELLSFLADSIPAARVLLLLTHRPGYRPRQAVALRVDQPHALGFAQQGIAVAERHRSGDSLLDQRVRVRCLLAERQQANAQRGVRREVAEAQNLSLSREHPGQGSRLRRPVYPRHRSREQPRVAATHRTVATGMEYHVDHAGTVARGLPRGGQLG